MSIFSSKPDTSAFEAKLAQFDAKLHGLEGIVNRLTDAERTIAQLDKRQHELQTTIERLQALVLAITPTNLHRPKTQPIADRTQLGGCSDGASRVDH